MVEFPDLKGIFESWNVACLISQINTFPDLKGIFESALGPEGILYIALFPDLKGIFESRVRQAPHPIRLRVSRPERNI